MRVGFIGGGFMGEALVSALLDRGVAQPSDVCASDVAESRRQHMADTYGVRTTADNAEAASGADVVVLAVKPQEFSKVAAGLRGKLAPEQAVASIMAGVGLRRLVDELQHEAVVRVMPNTPAFVGEAMSVWTGTSAVSDEAMVRVRTLLQAFGREVQVSDERYIDMATALSGSGPGYVYLFLEAMVDAGVHIGLGREVAQELAVQTLLGSARMAQETGSHLAELRNMVTSPGGTTAAGLQVLEEAGFRGAIIDAIEAAYERAKELGG